MKFPMIFFTWIEKLVLSCTCILKGPSRIGKAILKNNNKVWSFMLPNFKAYQSCSNKNNVTQAYRPLGKNRETQRNPACMVKFFWQDFQAHSMEERTKFINKWCWENWIAVCKRMKLDPYITQYRKIRSKWIKYLNVGTKAFRINYRGKAL